jgi:hypothetical protein
VIIELFDSENQMNELGKEISALIDSLEKLNSPAGSTEHTAKSHLKRLMAGLDNTEDAKSLEPAFAELEQFWLSSVAWCSQLSKDIEKVIIIFQELR